jgi:hypothetical protein
LVFARAALQFYRQTWRFRRIGSALRSAGRLAGQRQGPALRFLS